MAIKKGTQVRQVIKPIEGVVAGFQVDGETGEVQYLVEWKTEGGDVQSKYFKDDDIDLMSGSGVFMVVQSEPTSIPYCVYQTTTTSTDKLEDKEDSIVATVDFASKFYRDNLRSVLGKFNVNEVSLKYVATVIRDITDRMKRMNYQYIGSILSDGKLLSISSDKDRIIPIISIKVPFPVNYIDLYIQY